MSFVERKIVSRSRYKFPLEQNVAENAAEDKKCLAIVEELIDEWAKKGNPVAGLIIEPIQGEGGDNRASDEFFRALKDLTEKKGSSEREAQSSVPASAENLRVFSPPIDAARRNDFRESGIDRVQGKIKGAGVKFQRLMHS